MDWWRTRAPLQLSTLKNDLFKFLPKGAVGDKEEMEELDGEQVLCCGPEAAASPFASEQWGERGDAAVHPQQEQLTDTHVQPSGRDSQPQPAHLSAWLVRSSISPALNSPSSPAVGPTNHY